VLDLKDKIKIKSGKINDWASQVAQALESLGYSAKESGKIAEQVASEMKSQSSENVIVSEALKLALQIAGRSKRA
jgi:Holliday junction resolvasome RuvABC DNA-binding subunit